MELSALSTLGKVAGFGGIAVGFVLLLVRPMVAQSAGLPAAQRARMLRLIAGGAFGIGALGIVAWMVSPSPGVTVQSGACSVAANGTALGNSITCGALPAAATKP